MSPTATRIFAFAATLGLNVKIGGARLTEVVLVGVAVWAVVEWLRTRQVGSAILVSRRGVLLLGSALLLVAATVVSDLFTNPPSDWMLKGFLRSVILVLDLVGTLYLVGKDWRTATAMFAGKGCGDLLVFLMDGAKSDELWKFGIGFPISVGVLMLACRWPGRLTAALLTLLGVLHIALDYRSLGAACLVTGVLLLFADPNRPLSIRRMVSAAVFALVATIGAYVLSDTAQSTRAESSNRERTALIATAWSGFLASPLVGQGSGYSDDRAVRDALHRMVDRGEREDASIETDAGLTVHSQILSALADSGFFAGVFFLHYGWLLVSAFPLALRHEHTGRALSLFLMIDGTFQLFMSPLTSTARFEVSLNAAVALGLILIFKTGRQRTSV